MRARLRMQAALHTENAKSMACDQRPRRWSSPGHLENAAPGEILVSSTVTGSGARFGSSNSKFGRQNESTRPVREWRLLRVAKAHA